MGLFKLIAYTVTAAAAAVTHMHDRKHRLPIWICIHAYVTHPHPLCGKQIGLLDILSIRCVRVSDSAVVSTRLL